MAQTPFDFEVITPEGSSFRGRVVALRLQGKQGSFGVLAHHAPLIAVLDAGVVRAQGEDGRSRAFAAGDGFVEVRPNGVRVLVDFCNTKEQIDVARAEKAKQRAQARLKERDSKVDHARAEASLRRATVRLSTSQWSGLD